MTLINTVAETIANHFDHGQCFVKDGRKLEDACSEECVNKQEEGTSLRFEFLDKSAIVISSGGWDLGFNGEDSDCFCWAGADEHNKGCAEQEKAREIFQSAACGSLADYLVAPHGHRFGVYANGKVLVGQDVGNEIADDEKPLVWIPCPGIDKANMAYWREGWDTSALDDESCIRACCENAEIDDEVVELERVLQEAFGLEPGPC